MRRSWGSVCWHGQGAGHSLRSTTGIQEHPCPLQQGCSSPAILGDAAQAQGGRSWLSLRILCQQQGWCCPRSGCQHHVPSPKPREHQSHRSPRTIPAERHHHGNPQPCACRPAIRGGTLLGTLFLLMTNGRGSELTKEMSPVPGIACSPSG